MLQYQTASCTKGLQSLSLWAGYVSIFCKKVWYFCLPESYLYWKLLSYAVAKCISFLNNSTSRTVKQKGVINKSTLILLEFEKRWSDFASLKPFPHLYILSAYLLHHAFALLCSCSVRLDSIWSSYNREQVSICKSYHFLHLGIN